MTVAVIQVVAQDQGAVNAGQVHFGQRVLLQQSGLPCVNISGEHIVGDQILAVGGVGETVQEHDVVAVLGLHHAVVTDLAAFSEAPVVERSDHLTGCNVFVKTAGFLGTGVGGLLGGQSGKALGISVAGQPGIVDLLSLGLGCFLLCGGVSDLTGGLVGGTALKVDQNVTDVDQRIVVLKKVL